MWALFSLSYRDFISNPFRGAILIVAVALGLAGFSGVQLVNEAIGRGVEQAWFGTAGVAHLYTRAFSEAGFPDDSIVAVRGQPGVQTVAPAVRKRVFFRSADFRGFVELIGVDPIPEIAIRGYRLQAGRFLLADEAGVVVPASWASENGVRLNDNIDMITRDGFRAFPVVGLLSADGGGIASYGATVLVPLQLARQAFGMENRVESLAIVLGDERDLPQVQAALRGLLPGAFSVTTAGQVRAAVARSVAQIEANLSLFGAIAFFLSIFMIVNTIEMTSASHLQQTGRFRAVGATRPQIVSYFVGLALIPGVVGALLGVLLGYGLAQAFAAWMSQLQQIAVAPIVFSPVATGFSLLAGVLGVGLAALAPAIHAARTNPLELVGDQGDAPERFPWTVELIGVFLVVLSLLAGLLLPAIEAAPHARLALLLPLLIGLVLGTRVAVHGLSRAILAAFERLRDAPGRLAAENLLRHGTRTSMTVSGLGVSLSLMIALAAVAVGAAQAGEHRSRALLPGEYAIVSAVDQPPVFVDRFAALPGVQRASPVSFVQTLSAGTPIQLALVEPEVIGPGLQYQEGTAAQAREALGTGGAAIVPRRLAAERGLRLGDELAVEGGEGPARFRIAAIVASSFPAPDGGGSALISRADGERHFGTRTFRFLSLELASGTAPAAMKEAVDELAERYGMTAITRQEIAGQVAGALFRLLALFGALVGITMVIAIVGTANTMLTNIAERQRELSILWATGMSRRQLQAMVVIEAAFIGLMGGLLGTLIGAFLARVLVDLWSTSDFRPEYNFPVGAAAIGVFIAVVASVIAAVGPARASSRLDIGP
jgi:putative ABC transport system permease protein